MKKLLVALIITLFIFTFAHAELVKQTVVDRIEVLSNGCVQVREATRVIEDGKLISQQFHRYVVSPGEDYSKRDAKVQAVCAKVQTAEVIAAYKDSISKTPTPPVVTPGLVKETKISKVHILEDGTLIAEKRTEVLEDGKVLGSTKQIEKIVPGTDVTEKEQGVKDLAEVIQTKAVIDAYNVAHPVVVEVSPIVEK